MVTRRAVNACLRRGDVSLECVVKVTRGAANAHAKQQALSCLIEHTHTHTHTRTHAHGHRQTDLVPTLSALLRLPIPFGRPAPARKSCDLARRSRAGSRNRANRHSFEIRARSPAHARPPARVYIHLDGRARARSRTHTQSRVTRTRTPARAHAQPSPGQHHAGQPDEAVCVSAFIGINKANVCVRACVRELPRLPMRAA